MIRRRKKDDRPRRSSTTSRRTAEATEYVAGVAESQADLLVDVRDLLMHILMCQACPTCKGSGFVGQGNGTESVCKCRLRAVALVAELMQDEAAALEEDPDDDEEGNE